MLAHPSCHDHRLSCTLHFIRVVLSIHNMLRTSKIWCGGIQLQSQHLGGGCKMIILEKLARLFQNDNKIIMSTFELLMTLSHCLGDSCSSGWVFGFANSMTMRMDGTSIVGATLWRPPASYSSSDFTNTSWAVISLSTLTWRYGQDTS